MSWPGGQETSRTPLTVAGALWHPGGERRGGGEGGRSGTTWTQEEGLCEGKCNVECMVCYHYEPCTPHPQIHLPGISPRVYLQHHILQVGRGLLLVLRGDSSQQQNRWKGHLLWTLPYYHRPTGLSLFFLLSWHPSHPLMCGGYLCLPSIQSSSSW